MQWGVGAINKAVRRISQEGLEVEREIRSQMIDILGTIALVKAYSQEKTEADRYGLALHQLERVAVRRDGIGWWSSGTRWRRPRSSSPCSWPKES